MRGRLLRDRDICGRLRLIPACAGQTWRTCPRRRRLGAHPRVCGADVVLKAHVAEVPGSSPRVRGRPGEHVRVGDGWGLIPACAGQTSYSRLMSRKFQAHPRVCGADAISACAPFEREGSSPRVRGRQCLSPTGAATTGLIPACAGQTWLYVQAGSVTWAHPRVCGADPQVGHSETVVNGSSPRVRGRRPDHQDDLPLVWAHPRVCGADCPGRERLDGHLGSSPRVRGRRATAGEKQHAQGLIPACAGQTPNCLHEFFRRWAHPRVCGADLYAENAEIQGRGSSPRVRGRRHDVPGQERARGLIPACAGQTISVIVSTPAGEGSSPRVRGRPRFFPARPMAAGLIPACAGQTRPPQPSAWA